MRGMESAWVFTGGAAATAQAESPRSLSCGSSAARSALGMMSAPARSWRPLRSKSSSATCILTSLFLKRNVDRKSTRLNSSHLGISYAVFCLKKKKKISFTDATQIFYFDLLHILLIHLLH